MTLRGILLDIEGTILPKAYVTEVLFPYAQKHLATYLHAHQKDQTVRRWAAMCQETIAKESGAWLPYDGMAGILTQWMTGDRKHQGLKGLQGMIWEEGYRTGLFAPKLYGDVVPALRRWGQEHLQLAIYSSGSEQAQRLLLEHTTEGDLTPLFSHFFDTGMGSKLEPASYGRIAERLGFQPSDVLFLSDAEPELDAAAAAGLQTIHIVRPGTDPGARHRVYSTFDDLRGINLPFGETSGLSAPVTRGPLVQS
jgi:enolase-phosphatase E1